MDQLFQAAFYNAHFTNLPITGETADHKFCYMQHRPTIDTSGCTADPVQAVVTDEIQTYSGGSGAVFLAPQCNQLLRAQLPYAKHWFNQLFPNFVTPTISDNKAALVFQGTIYLWILGMGPKVIQGSDWDVLRGLIDNPSTDWTQVLAWVEDTPSYITGGLLSSSTPLPASFVTWLARPEVCPLMQTANCPYLYPLIYYSTVCDAQCEVKSVCANYKPTSYCATQP